MFPNIERLRRRLEDQRAASQSPVLTVNGIPIDLSSERGGTVRAALDSLDVSLQRLLAIGDVDDLSGGAAGNGI